VTGVSTDGAVNTLETNAVRVDVWWLRLDEDPDVSVLEHVLTPEEKARSAPWKHEPRRREFLAGRALLRFAAHQWNLPAGWLALAPSGRPVTTVAGVDVSLSHSGPHVMAALAQHAQVGVDVAHHTPRDPALLHRYFHPEERAFVGQDNARLHRVWALKEAALKALGVGVSGDPLRVRTFGNEDRITLLDPAPKTWCTTWVRDTWCAGAVLLAATPITQPHMRFMPVSFSTLVEHHSTTTVRKTG
jgi:phosphopantetheinyl transferase